MVDALGEALQRGPTAQPNGSTSLTIAEIVDRIDPATDAIGFSVMFSQQWPHGSDRARDPRRFHVPIFIAASTRRRMEFVLDNCPAVTACAIGEGEQTISISRPTSPAPAS